MMVEVYLVNYCDEELGQWLSLPASNAEIKKLLMKFVLMEVTDFL